MFISPRIRLRALVALCRNLATSTRAGLQDRRIWQSESQRGSRAQRQVVGQVSDALARGDTVGDALRETGDFFPPMFRQVVQVGDSTGQLDRAYRQLTEHYERMLAARRAFLAALAWPMIQLGLAVAVVGVVIWLSSYLNLKDVEGSPLDMFGLGLTGSRGLAIYLTILTFIVIAGFFCFEAARRGMMWTKTLERAALKIPVIGGALSTLALARFTWALQLVLDTPMDLRKALPLALEASGNDYYVRQGPAIVRSVAQGNSMYLAMAETGAFPRELLEAIAVGEQSGSLPETMERVSADYRERAAVAISVLAQALGYLIWAAVAALIIVLIFRVFGAYIAPIQKMSSPNFKF
jgi:type IV pilus assembly protein PilC